MFFVPFLLILPNLCLASRNFNDLPLEIKTVIIQDVIVREMEQKISEHQTIYELVKILAKTQRLPLFLICNQTIYTKGKEILSQRIPNLIMQIRLSECVFRAYNDQLDITLTTGIKNRYSDFLNVTPIKQLNHKISTGIFQNKDLAKLISKALTTSSDYGSYHPYYEEFFINEPSLLGLFYNQKEFAASASNFQDTTLKMQEINNANMQQRHIILNKFFSTFFLSINGIYQNNPKRSS